MTVQLKVSANGRVCIPADVRARLGLKDGDTVMLSETENGLMLQTPDQLLKEARARFKAIRGSREGSAVDEFLEWKREETRREEEQTRASRGA
jgi:AbrB family looped-hinge helix DNA binding protein